MIQESKKKKHKMPKDVVSAINKANRDEDIKSHGKPCELKGKKSENPKAYKRSKVKKMTLDDINEMVYAAVKRVLKEEKENRGICVHFGEKEAEAEKKWQKDMNPYKGMSYDEYEKAKREESRKEHERWKAKGEKEYEHWLHRFDDKYWAEKNKKESEKKKKKDGQD